MNTLEFLKPTVGKIILFLALMFALNYFVIAYLPVTEPGLVLAGLPLGFWLVGSSLGTLKLAASVNFSPLSFVVDIVFWYVVTCFIITEYRKIREEKSTFLRSP